MPTYDYRCNACNHTFDLVQTMSAPLKRKCPACAKLKLERLIGTGAGFIIKGRTSPPSSEREASSRATTDDVIPSTPTTTASSSKDETSSDSSQTKKPTPDGADSKPVESSAKAESPPAEKRISGATSTPTHKAREGRGVGNLVDKARRMASKKSAVKPKPATKPKAAPKATPAKKARRNAKRG